MSEVAQENEAVETPADPAEPWEGEVTNEEQANAVMRKRQPHASLVDAAKDAFDRITAPEGEVESVPAPNQEPVTAARRQAAVEQARAAEQSAPAETLELDEAREEVELPPLAPEDWLNEEPDYDAEARAELAEEPEDVEEYEFDDDPRLQEEKVKRLALEKRLAHVEAQRLQDARKNWVAEALEHAPLAVHEYGEKLEGIDAKSKRDFLRKAAAGHNKVRGIMEAIHGPTATILKEEVEQVRAKAKAEAARDYGNPTSGPGAAPVAAAETAAKVAAAREAKGFRGAVRAMIDAGLNP